MQFLEVGAVLRMGQDEAIAARHPGKDLGADLIGIHPFIEGITARGAWESVKLHFRELGKDIQSEDFSVIAIGDMAGDVFGNGMLLSEHIQLCAAFNHLHIFIDPEPDAASSFVERKRLFELPRSSWEDYNRELISAGGGIFSRAAKWLDISPQMQARFDIKETRLSPNELLTALLNLISRSPQPR